MTSDNTRDCFIAVFTWTRAGVSCEMLKVGRSVHLSEYLGDEQDA